MRQTNKAGNSYLDISFKPVGVDDLPLLADWMKAPHWTEWWGDADRELGDICDMIEGKDTTSPFLILVDGHATGYIQYWHVGHHQNPSWISQCPWLADLPAAAVGVDLSIGAGKDLSKGIGTAALSSFVGNLRTFGYETIIIDPDPDNKRAIRSYEKAGFKFVEAFNRNTKDGCVIMQHEPN